MSRGPAGEPGPAADPHGATGSEELPAARPVGAGPVGAGPVGAGPVGAGPVGAGPVGAEPAAGRPSGLRNPAAAVRGLGAATLAIEALVLVLAIQPIRVLGGQLSSWAVAVVIGLALLALVLAGLLRRGWAWRAATLLPVLVLVAGLLHWSLAGLGLTFAAVWAYVLHVRRSILR